MRSPRSSFHHDVVTRSVERLSSSRASAMPARRTAMNVPLRGDPQIHVHTPAAGRLRVTDQPQFVEQRLQHIDRHPLGSRNRCPAGDPGRSATRRDARCPRQRTGQGCSVTVPICAAQPTTPSSVGQISSACRPDRNVQTLSKREDGSPRYSSYAKPSSVRTCATVGTL